MMTPKQLKEFERRFYDKETTAEHIRKLKKLDLTKIDQSFLDQMIDQILRQIPFILGPIEPGVILYRARRHVLNSPFHNISELGINKPENIKTYGRANWPNEAVFYASTEPIHAIWEVLHDLKTKPIDRNLVSVVTISCWEITSNLNLAHVYYSDAVIHARSDLQKHKLDDQRFVRENSAVDHQILDISDLIMEFFSDEYSKENITTHYDYKISASYAARLKEVNSFISPQNQLQHVDGVLYPSVASKFNGENIALFNENLNDKIKFLNASQVICKDLDFTELQMKYMRIYETDRVDRSGNLTWKTIQS